MSAAEFDAWRAYDAISPIGGERADRHAALIASILGNAYRDTKKKPDPFTIDDFDLYQDPPKPKTRAEEEAAFRAAFAAAGLVAVKQSEN